MKENYEIEKLENEDIRKKYEEIQGNIKNMGSDLACQDKSSLMAQVTNLENTMDFLTKEHNDLSQKNGQLIEKLSKKDFFREYEYMQKEVRQFGRSSG